MELLLDIKLHLNIIMRKFFKEKNDKNNFFMNF